MSSSNGTRPLRVVITGVGAVSPNGIGREAFWEATRVGRSGVRRISLIDASCLPAQIAGEVTDFDESAYIAPRERVHVSRAVPLAFAASEEALTDAGMKADRMDVSAKRQVGVVLGSGGGNQEFTEEQYRLYYSGQIKKVSVYTIPSSTIGTLASEISMRFGFRGFSHLISTGCTSSTDALGYAVRNIQAGAIGTVLAGGVDAPIAPLIIRGFHLMRILSTSGNHDPQRASRPFSASRDGFVLGEGAWMFVLEEREAARRRGARIYAEISGYGSTCDAYHRVRLEECGQEPARAMKLAVDGAGLRLEDIDYVNLHGTSTVLNDRIETKALKICFGGHAYRLVTSALKSIIGHPQGACGAAGVAATVLAMRDGVAPPTINLDQDDPECDLDYCTDIGRRLEIRHAVCNCIAFGSKNSALVLSRP